MSNEIERVDAHIYGCSEPLAALRLDGRPAGFTRVRNRYRQTESVHAAAGDCDMRIPQEPFAVVDVENHVRRYNDPLAFVYAAELHVAGRTFEAPGKANDVGSRGSGQYGIGFDPAFNTVPPLPAAWANFHSLERQTGVWTLEVTHLALPTSILVGDWEFVFTVS